MNNKSFTIIGLFALTFGIPAAFSAEYDRILGQMKTLAAENPGWVELFELGQNNLGETIHGIRIADPVSGTIPNLVVGTHHGNERKAADLAIQFSQDFLAIAKNSASSENEKLRTRVMYVVPVLNVNGFNANSRHERTQNGSFDPNRDYPDACDKSKPPFSLKSTNLIANFIHDKQIVSAITIHGYIGTFTFPWGYYTENYKTLDHDFYHSVGKKSVASNGYRTGTHGDLIYPAAGTFEDWTYYTYGVWTALVEMAHSPNIKNDSKMMVSFFTQLPDVRSVQNKATGDCSRVRSLLEIGRP